MKTTLFIFLQISVICTFAQLGGSYTYAYLQLPPSARIAALGGSNVSMQNDDANFGFQNPALYNSLMHQKISASHALLTGNINQGYVSYAHQLNKINATFGSGIFYRSYGTIPFTDETGVTAGSFKASEYIVQSGIAYHSNKIGYGANVKLLYSQLESYNSVGAAIDIGVSYFDTANQLSAGFVLRNIGTQFISYSENANEELPFEMEIGISKRLDYLPLRISLTAHNLQQSDIRYSNPNAIESITLFSNDTTSETEEKKYIGDKILRHLILGGEFYFGKNFSFRAGYDYLNAKELALSTKRGLTGFSFGAGMKINKYQIDYTHEFYSVAGGSNMITIAANLGSFIKK